MKPLALIFRFLYAGMGAPSRPGVRKPPSARSAAINRWTGKPHEHNRAKARRLSQLATQRITTWGAEWAASSRRAEETA